MATTHTLSISVVLLGCTRRRNGNLVRTSLNSAYTASSTDISTAMKHTIFQQNIINGKIVKSAWRCS